MNPEDKKKMAALRRIAKLRRMGISRRRDGYMIFDLVTSRIVCGNVPFPCSMKMSEVEAYFEQIKHL